MEDNEKVTGRRKKEIVSIYRQDAGGNKGRRRGARELKDVERSKEGGGIARDRNDLTKNEC